MAKPKNERKTETLVREALAKSGYYAKGSGIRVEEQKSEIESAAKLLKAASKSGKGGGGSVEFIISGTDSPDFILVIECKADTKDHSSAIATAILAGETAPAEEPAASTKRVQRFAVDGAMHYAKALSKEFNVIALAVSGETAATLTVSAVLHTKGAERARPLLTKAGAAITRVLPWSDLIEHATFDPSVQRLHNDELMAFSRDLHDFMRDHAKLTESEKPLVVSGTLIALRDPAFLKAYDAYSASDLPAEWLSVIKKEIFKASIPHAKKTGMVQPYSSIAVHPVLGTANAKYPKGVLNELVRRLKEKVYPFISYYHDFDVVGQFYGEFLKYTGGDKKALGIVLTPRHVTELFALLANVKRDSTCLDICAGTGGFLISAMVQMLKDAKTAAQRERIREKGLIGVEQQPNMFALAASNMILRGDGKANLYQGSCFEKPIEKLVRGHKADVGFLNPPYSQADVGLGEMVFVRHMLDCLAPGGTGIAIVPMSCAISPDPTRAAVLTNHTLEAVMSMPDDLFHPVGTVTCIMVFTAHKPHAKSDKKTWFGYWKDDGFVKTKHRGRVDINGTWPAIRDRWVEMFRNREVHPGVSVTRKVGADDEWCAEAYMDTDYSKITEADFQQVVRNYAVFRLLGASGAAAELDGDAESTEEKNVA